MINPISLHIYIYIMYHSSEITIAHVVEQDDSHLRKPLENSAYVLRASVPRAFGQVALKSRVWRSFGHSCWTSWDFFVVKPAITNVWCWKQKKTHSFLRNHGCHWPRNNNLFVGILLFGIRVKLSNLWDDFDIKKVRCDFCTWMAFCQ